jgi:hypothetical protein
MDFLPRASELLLVSLYRFGSSEARPSPGLRIRCSRSCASSSADM